MVAFSVKDIRAAVSPAAFGKAMDYAHQGRVLEYSVTDNGHIIRARTQGDARKPYAQEISVEPQSSGRVDFEGTCSCPMAYNCKHVAAVLLDVLSEEDGMSDNTLPPRPPSLEAALPHDIATWLGALDAARGADDEAYPDDQTTRIFYILSTVEVSDGAVPRLMVRPVSVRLRSDGSLPQRVSKLSLGYDAPLFARPADRRILRHLVGGWSDGDHEIRKEEAGDMLKRILATAVRDGWRSTARRCVRGRLCRRWLRGGSGPTAARVR